MISLGYKPNPKQLDFFRARAKHIAYGGARGGGKSWAMRTKLIMLAERYPGIQILLLRRTLPELRENHIIPMMQTLAGHATYNQQDKVFRFPNGSRIVCGYCAAEADALQYQGQSYDAIGMEEATQFTEQQMIWITSASRPTIDGFRARVYYTCNPGGVGHMWVKRLFIDRQYRAEERPEDYVMIKARVQDNYVLMQRDPDYIRILQNMPEDMRRAHLDGDWDVFAGQFFPEFRREIHTVEPLPIPDHWQRYRALDYGLDRLACLWAAFDELGNAYIYRELCESNLIVSEAAKRITSHGDRVRATYAPADLWGRQKDSGLSMAELFAKNGVPLAKVRNARVDGWANLKEWINPAGGSPKLHIFSTCQELISCLPQLQHDEHDPCDVATQPHNITHAPDALRYLMDGRPRPAQRAVTCDEYDPVDYDEQVQNFLEYGR